MTETALRFGIPANGAADASDSDFIAAVHWRSSNPGIGSELNSDSDARALGMCWKHHCLSLSVPASVEPRFHTLDEIRIPDSAGPLAEFRALVGRTSSTKKQLQAAGRQLENWLAADSSQLADPAVLLACCELLILRSQQLPATTVGQLWRSTLCAAIDQSTAFAEFAARDDWDEPAVEIEDALDEWLSGGLLPWVCGNLFDEVKGAPRLVKTARAALHEQLRSLVIDDGHPDGTVLDGLPILMGTLHDALLIATLFERNLWKARTSRTWKLLLERCATMAAANGHLTIEAEDPSRAVSLLNSCARLSSHQTETWAGMLADIALNPSNRRQKKSAQKKKSQRPESAAGKKVRRRDIPSWQSDDAEVACLRTTWTPHASAFTLAYHNDYPFLNLSIDGVPLLHGEWGLSVTEDGELLACEPAWQNVCWHSEPEVDYCEIEYEFEGGPKVSRHVVLPRQRQFAIISDIVNEISAGDLEWQTHLPLASGVNARPCPGTREYRLKVGSKTARVFPLILPQDTGVGTTGAIEADEAGESLNIRHPATHGGVFAPVVIDWSRDNRKAEAEWKRLTTTTAGQIDPEGSVAYRLQFGERHLMLFRSLIATRRYRAAIGFQTDSETVLGDFRNGEIDEFVIVE